ncbi:MAG: helix-hairpin-helix domain-containing protein [Myxococcales bacterium]|nr:helix-hairpin-helix domain-containing protein [Myxococcales bacterium]MCB9569288.1 helix-hairpin-helix domain-containing protein [Myxococcales bacterium]MCB9705886.1 helix-hairpin-helix domain-containing protein [Myxococcales bacterium]
MKKLIQTLLGAAALASALTFATPASAAPELSGRININTATEAELDLLPGVGPSIAHKVITYRESKPFGDITHLLRIKGIGRKTFAKLKPFLSIDGATTLHVVDGDGGGGADDAKAGGDAD